MVVRDGRSLVRPELPPTAQISTFIGYAFVARSDDKWALGAVGGRQGKPLLAGIFWSFATRSIVHFWAAVVGVVIDVAKRVGWL